MLYVVINKHPKYSNKFLQQMLIKYLRKETKNSSIIIKLIIIIDECVSDKDLVDVVSDDFILWTPICASQNLSHVKKYINSVVVLENKTTYIRKLSDLNPINENMSINNNFKIMYLRNYEDITNDEYKLIIEPQLITFEEISKQLKINNEK